MFCPECGTKNRDVSKFCMKCGAALPAVTGRPTSTTTPAPSSPRRRGRLLLLVGAPALLLVLVAGAFTLLRGGAVPFIGGGEKMLVAFPNRNNESDLYLLSPGQELEEGLLLAEDALAVDELLYYRHKRTAHQWDQFSTGNFGAFIPGADQLLFWYREEGDDDAIISAIQINDEDAYELLSSDAYPIFLNSSDGFEQLHLVETRNDTSRCYNAQTGDVAQRLTKGDQCSMVGDGSLVYAAEEDDGALTVTMVDVASGEEQFLLDDIEDVAGRSLRFSDDGSHMAYVQTGRNGSELFLLDRETGDSVAVGETYDNILSYSFIPGRDTLYYLVRDDDEDVALYLSTFESPIASGYAMDADADHTGNYLLYIIGDDDGENTVYLYNMGTGDVTMLMQEDALEARLGHDLDTVFLWERDDDEYTLYSVPVAGDQPSRIANFDDVDSLLLRYVDGAQTAFVQVSTLDGRESLYVTPLHTSDGFYIVEDWEYLQLLNISPDKNQIVFYAIEDPGDDPVLLLSSLRPEGGLVELDSVSDEFYNAVFSADGRDVIYTAHRGSSGEDYEIVRVPATAETPGELLYEEAYLDAVSWTSVNPPFKNIIPRSLQR